MQAGLSLTWSKNPEDRFSHDDTQLWFTRFALLPVGDREGSANFDCGFPWRPLHYLIVFFKELGNNGYESITVRA